MTYFDVYAWIMFIHVQTCLPSDSITSGNRELLFHSHNAIDLQRGQQERLGQHGTFKSQALWSVRDGKGLIPIFYKMMMLQEYTTACQSKLRWSFYFICKQMKESARVLL
jgi:hypothetical protein